MYCIECAAELPDKAKFCHQCASPQQGGTFAPVVASNATVLPPSTKLKAKQETVFLERRNVTVTSTRFIVPSQTYAVANITSVRFDQIPAKRGWPIVFCILGTACLFNSDVRIFGIVILIVGALWLYGVKDEYAVSLTTAAGEVRAVADTNRQYIEEILDALDRAIVHRQ